MLKNGYLPTIKRGKIINKDEIALLEEQDETFRVQSNEEQHKTVTRRVNTVQVRGWIVYQRDSNEI